MNKLMASAVIVVLSAWGASRAQEPTPFFDLTARAVIAEAASQAYRQALQPCPGTPGSAPQGAKFLACLKQQLRRESETLAGAAAATLALLKASAERTAKFRSAQGAWTKFRDENCAFARAVAPTDAAMMFYYDCLLRATVDRRVELRSLVGD